MYSRWVGIRWAAQRKSCACGPPAPLVSEVSAGRPAVLTPRAHADGSQPSGAARSDGCGRECVAALVAVGGRMNCPPRVVGPGGRLYTIPLRISLSRAPARGASLLSC
eukprot:7383750-Prymnesium_polylepis.1